MILGTEPSALRARTAKRFHPTAQGKLARSAAPPWVLDAWSRRVLKAQRLENVFVEEDA
jgi:hypothetical protein